MTAQRDHRRREDLDGLPARPAPAFGIADHEPPPPALLGDRRLAGQRGGGTRAALVRQLQRAAGNDKIQRLLASQAVSRQPDSGAEAADPVVDDSATELAPGQMRRAPFLAALRGEVEGALASAGPLARADAAAHLPAAFADLEAQDTAGLLRSLRENLPGVEGADARRWIVAAGVAARARIAGEAPAAATGVVGRVLSAVRGLASALFKLRDGGATRPTPCGPSKPGRRSPARHGHPRPDGGRVRARLLGRAGPHRRPGRRAGGADGRPGVHRRPGHRVRSR